MNCFLFGPGCFGPWIHSLQEALHRAGFDPGPIDGLYGPRTAGAVRAFSKSHSLPERGEITLRGWSLLGLDSPPSLFERSLQLVAALEWTACRGQNPFGCVTGNFDGQGLTWGVIGFTLRGGQVGRILDRVNQADPLLLPCLDGEKWDDLRPVLRASPTERVRWGESISLHQGQHVEPGWLKWFARLGEEPLVRKVQQEVVWDDYWRPAMESAHALELKTEWGLALCFDIHVQNGHATRAKKRLQQYHAECQCASTHTEKEHRRILAERISAGCKPIWRNAVFKRKHLFVAGKGTVNGYVFSLPHWGLQERCCEVLEGEDFME